MSIEVKVTQLKNKIVVDNTANVVHVITQGEQGAKGLELSDINKVDGSVIRWNSSANSYVADATVTPLTLTDGGNF